MSTAVARIDGAKEVAQQQAPKGAQLTDEFVQQLNQRWKLAEILAKSGMIPQRLPEAAFAVMLKAHELGVPAMQGFAQIHFFDGKLAISATLMGALAMERCGVRWSVLEQTAERCAMRFKRNGWDPLEVDWTIAEAKSAGLAGKNNWKNYPADMLFARCLARGIRRIAPDFASGNITVEEVRDGGHDVSEYVPAAPSPVDALNAELEAGGGDGEPGTEGGDGSRLEAADALARHRAGVLKWLDKTEPDGGDATDEQRDRARELAARAFDDGPERDMLLTAIGVEGWGGTQLKALAGKLLIAAEAASGQAALFGG